MDISVGLQWHKMFYGKCLFIVLLFYWFIWNVLFHYSRGYECELLWNLIWNVHHSVSNKQMIRDGSEIINMEGWWWMIWAFMPAKCGFLLLCLAKSDPPPLWKLTNSGCPPPPPRISIYTILVKVHIICFI